MSSILVNNFPSVATGYSARADNGQEIRFIIGHDDKSAAHKLLENAVEKIFTSILVHDKIYIGPDDFISLAKFLGIKDTLTLMRENIICIIKSRLSHCLEVENKNLSLGWINAVDTIESYFDKELKKLPLISRKEIDQASLLIDGSGHAVDADSVTKKATKELEFDLGNLALKTELGITSKSISDIGNANSLKISRIMEIITGLSIQNELNISNISIDGFSEAYLNRKFSLLAPPTNKPVNTFEGVLQKKGVPNIYDLYKRKIISLDEILKLRNSINGIVFRKWYESTDYNDDEVVRCLLNGKQEKLQSTILRFLYPTIAGVINPFLGVAASAAESFLVSKIVAGWSPSLFLDNELKYSIDEKILKDDEAKRREKLRGTFGTTGRNDSCPCGSAKKFKKCHGKNL